MTNEPQNIDGQILGVLAKGAKALRKQAAEAGAPETGRAVVLVPMKSTRALVALWRKTGAEAVIDVVLEADDGGGALYQAACSFALRAIHKVPVELGAAASAGHASGESQLVVSIEGDLAKLYTVSGPELGYGLGATWIALPIVLTLPQEKSRMVH